MSKKRSNKQAEVQDSERILRVPSPVASSVTDADLGPPERFPVFTPMLEGVGVRDQT